MGSLRFEGVRFSVYSMDHLPPHVHGFYAGVEVVIDLLMVEQAVALSKRRKSIRPTNGSRRDVNYVLELAADRFEELVGLWRETHGEGTSTHN